MPATSPTNTHGPGPLARAVWRGSRRLLALRSVLAAVVVGVLSAGSTSPALADDTCANAAVRAQTNSTGLPDCRGYEMVSAPYKEGFQVELFGLRFTDDGAAAYKTFGSIADNPLGILLNSYHATRSATGWVTDSPSPSSELYDPLQNALQGESADLRSTLWQAFRRDVPGGKFGYYLRGPDGSMTRIGDAEDPALGSQSGVVGVSADLSHIVFNFGNGSTQFEHVGTGNEGPLRAASVDNHGQEQGSCFNSISPDGRVIVYSASCPLGVSQVWARIGGTVSVWASRSECTRSASDPGGACNAASSATYRGGAVDGSRVFFTTDQQLVNGDIDSGNDLYACDLPAGVPAPVGTANSCATLTNVAGAATDARVESVVSVSDDGSSVYFVAQGVLADNLGVGDVGPATGADAHNLYVWQRHGSNTAGSTRFVGRLDANDLSRGQTTPDGRFLLFLTANRLVTTGPGADVDDQVDGYRYDAVTKEIARVSTSVSGSGGNGSGFDVSMTSQASSMTADGSTVIFDTAEALSAGDTNGRTDVYVWHDGEGVSLISSGGGASQGITPSGRDIFFSTVAQVLDADGDFNRDIYDARIGGGFASVQTLPCSGDGCQDRRSQPPSLAGPGNAVSDGTGGVEASPAFSLRSVSAAQRRALAATGRVSLLVTANVAGTIGVKATMTTGGRSVTAGSAPRTLAAPGKVAVTLALAKKARAQLARRGKLTVKVSVSHSKVALDRSVTLRLVRGKAKAKRSAKRASALRPVVGMAGGRS